MHDGSAGLLRFVPAVLRLLSSAPALQHSVLFIAPDVHPAFIWIPVLPEIKLFDGFRAQRHAAARLGA